tara:strand:+ start:236 stop:568 length:333 start_codon:yes stop_codon:yes gene_type:complete
MGIFTSYISASAVITGSDLSVGEITASGTISGSITASVGQVISNTIELRGTALAANEPFFLIKSGSFESFQVDTKGVFRLGSFATAPTAVSGGVYYNGDENDFFMGKEDE